SSSTKAKVIQVDDIEKTIQNLIKDSSPVLTTKDMKNIYQKLSLFTSISNTHKQ
ncbi:NERD domain-containing protein, partial [Bacillus toyonensis]